MMKTTMYSSAEVDAAFGMSGWSQDDWDAWSWTISAKIAQAAREGWACIPYSALHYYRAVKDALISGRDVPPPPEGVPALIDPVWFPRSESEALVANVVARQLGLPNTGAKYSPVRSRSWAPRTEEDQDLEIERVWKHDGEGGPHITLRVTSLRTKEFVQVTIRPLDPKTARIWCVQQSCSEEEARLHRALCPFTSAAIS